MGSEKQAALKAVIEAYMAGTNRWIEAFHGASTRALREAKYVGVDLANQLRIAVDDFTLHAVPKLTYKSAPPSLDGSWSKAIRIASGRKLRGSSQSLLVFATG